MRILTAYPLAALFSVALAAGPALGAPAPAAAPADSAAKRGAAPALPPSYSVDMRIRADGKDMTMTRYTNEAGDLRMDIKTEKGVMQMIQLNDEKQTMYTVMPERREVVKQSKTAMLARAGEHSKKAESPDTTREAQGTVELIGHEQVNGVMSDKYKVTSGGMEGTMWIDPSTHLIQRMQAENGAVDFTNYKIGPIAPATFQPPKGYKLTDMDEIMSKMPQGMGGMA